MTQTDLADATGMTPSHVNRVLQRFREDGTIKLRSKPLTVTDPVRLKALGQFNPAYLHLDRTEANDLAIVGRVGDLI